MAKQLGIFNNTENKCHGMTKKLILI